MKTYSDAAKRMYYGLISFSFHKQTFHIFKSIFQFSLSWCLFVCFGVCLYQINVKTAEPIGPKFFVGHHVIPRKVYGWSNFQKFASIKIRFLKILKIHEFFFENLRIFFLLFVNTPVYFISNKIFTNEIKDPKSLEIYNRTSSPGIESTKFSIYLFMIFL